MEINNGAIWKIQEELRRRRNSGFFARVVGDGYQLMGLQNADVGFRSKVGKGPLCRAG